MTELERISRDPISRRAFLMRMGSVGLGAAALTLLAGCGGSSNSNSNGNSTTGSNSAFVGIPGAGDTQVLNYALALETTEADIYRQALNIASGLAITTPLKSSPSAYTGATVSAGTVTDANAAYAYLSEYAFVEAAHRDFLLTALHHSPDAPNTLPTANTSNPVVNPQGYKFEPASDSLSDILSLILTAEEVGVTAYLGAVPDLSSLGNVQTAATIYSTEARHSSAIRFVLGKDIGPGNLTSPYTVPSGPYVSGSAHPAGTSSSAPEAVNEFEYALGPAAVLQMVKATFYND